MKFMMHMILFEGNKLLKLFYLGQLFLAELINMPHDNNLMSNEYGTDHGLHHDQDDGVHDEDGVGGQKKMLSLELNTFDPTYFNFKKIALKMKKWELKYQNGASPALKVTVPFLLPGSWLDSRATGTRRRKAASQVF